MFRKFFGKKSNISGFGKLSVKERLGLVKKFAGFNKDEIKTLEKDCALDIETAGRMIENVITTYQLPMGIATNFMINKKDYLIPMVLEEPSVVAAASNAAKLARIGGGFRVKTDKPVMIGQIQIVGVKDYEKAKKIILSNKSKIKKIANNRDSVIVKKGGGIKNIEVHNIVSKKGKKMVVVHIIVDVRDAMGANCVNTMAEAIAPYIEKITEGKSVLKIISNLATYRLAKATCTWKKELIGEDVVDGIIDAYDFADSDPYRCATNNKGIMNGIDAVAIATGNDFRALESGAHSYSAFRGGISLTKYEKDKKGNLVGSIELPVAVGIVGGITKTHPLAKISLKMLGVKSSQELAGVMASVGLANNFAALRAMVKEGIQKGHMKLHARNIAIMAGAKGNDIEKIVNTMISEKNVSVNRANELLNRENDKYGVYD